MMNTRISLILWLIVFSILAASCGPRFIALNRAPEANSATDESNTQDINKLAIAALSEPWAESGPLYCSRYVRQIVERYFEKKNIVVQFSLFGRTALETESFWKRANALYSLIEINQTGGLKPGDLLFQDYEDLGHVGIVVRIENQLYVSENTVRYGYNRTDYRALTELRKFGKIKSVGRL